ncbi:MFS transporter [Levilactobacillus namurensis]|uniref:MFS transporter n=1 Tax=Levilactobacillus namurensis TaxID=380393 RepID=UPI0004637104|nr:MFS transporter [Levilactobacillus namurensis]
MVTNQISNRQSLVQIYKAASSDIISSLSGDTFSFALSLMLLHTTHSAISFGLEAVIYPIVGILFVVPISNLVDRHDHKSLILISKAITLVALAGYSWVVFRVADRLLVSMMIVAIFGINDKVVGTTYTASVHELVNDTHLKPLATIEQAASSAVQLGSPLLAALLYAGIGFRGILVLELAGQAVVLGIAMTMHFYPLPKSSAMGNSDSQLAAFKVGLTYIHDHAVLWFIVQLSVWINLLFSAVNVGLSYMMVQVLKLGNVRLGWVSSSFALGMLVGSLMLLKLANFRNLIQAILRLVCGFGLSYLGIGSLLSAKLGPNTITLGLMVLGIVTGVFLAWINTPMGVYMQSTVPTQVMGRVSGTLTTLSALAMPLGTLLYSWLFQHVAGSLLFLVTGALLIGLAGFFSHRPYPVTSVQPSKPIS